MASLIHEISTHAYNKAKYLKSPGKDESGNPAEAVRITKKSERQYKDHAIKFGLWCKENYKCRHFDDCKPHIQDYADFLIEKGYSAGKIHTYLAAVCRIWNVAMDTIQKPVRHVAQNTRSRWIKASDSRKDAQREASPRLYDFASRVGLRRREHQKLSGGDLVEDKSGHLCIWVKGKGGKIQYQRILPSDIAFVRSYFEEKDADEYLFTREEMENKIDLHHLRACQAKRAYLYY